MRIKYLHHRLRGEHPIQRRNIAVSGRRLACCWPMVITPPRWRVAWGPAAERGGCGAATGSRVQGTQWLSVYKMLRARERRPPSVLSRGAGRFHKEGSSWAGDGSAIIVQNMM